MIPIIPLIALVCLFGGSGTLAWYYNLSKDQQEEADRLAAHYAARMFDKGMNQLAEHEARQVHAAVKRHFVN